MALSCHNNALYPDPVKARTAAEEFRETLQLAGMLEIPTVVGFSGCPGGNPTDTVPNWVVYDWPPEHGESLQWQWSRSASSLTGERQPQSAAFVGTVCSPHRTGDAP